jgi:glutamate-5-semialdehyde dehydrogenase
MRTHATSPRPGPGVGAAPDRAADVEPEADRGDARWAGADRRLPDPVGEVVAGWRRPNGLQINKVRVPLGVIGIIYESRPNVTVDAAALCLKAGNAVVLRGGSEAIHSNVALHPSHRAGRRRARRPRGALSLIETTDRAAARHLMTLNRYVDCLIPRGGARLIETVVKNATVPVIETGTGNCHVYVDASADREMAERDHRERQVLAPVGLQRARDAAGPHSDHSDFAQDRGRLRRRRRDAAAVPHAADRPRRVAGHATRTTSPSSTTLDLAVKVVNSLDEAIAHINHYGTRHSEAIVTRTTTPRSASATRWTPPPCTSTPRRASPTATSSASGGDRHLDQKLHARGPWAWKS